MSNYNRGLGRTAALAGFAALGAVWVGCNGDEPAAPPQTVSLARQTVQTPDQLPHCNASVQNAVYYVISTSTPVVCENGNWVPLTLPPGPTGATGATGPVGPTGATGLSTLIKITPVSDSSAQCPGAGGDRIDVGVDANKNAVLDDAEVQQTSFICNGGNDGPTGVGRCTADGDCGDGNACTDDFCTSGQCAHQMAAATTMCRPANGPCDQDEHCSGSSTVCPADTYSPASTVCNPNAGDCELDSRCTGTSTACPPNVLKPAGFTCRAAAGCAEASECDGATPTCPDASPVASGTVCAQAVACLSASTCDGTSLACSPQTPAPAGTVCGTASTCMVTATCDGVGSTCPNSVVAPTGTPCTASSNCNVPGTCSGSGTHCSANVTCTIGGTQTCCGGVVSGRQACNSTCSGYGVCNRASNDSYPSSSGAKTIAGGDATVAHDCGASREPTDNGWHTANHSFSGPWPSCGPGQRIAYIPSMQLPGGSYHVKFDGQLQGGTSISVAVQIYVNGAQVVSKQFDYTNSQFSLNLLSDVETLTLSDCSTVGLEVTLVSGSDYDFSVYDFVLY